MGLQWFKRQTHAPGSYETVNVVSSTATATVNPGGVVSLATTSTGAPVVITVNPPKANIRMSFAIRTLGSSSGAPFHLTASSSGTTFDGTNDMITLAQNPAGVEMVGLSSSRWLITAHVGAVLSTST